MQQCTYDREYGAVPAGKGNAVLTVAQKGIYVVTAPADEQDRMQDAWEGTAHTEAMCAQTQAMCTHRRYAQTHGQALPTSDRHEDVIVGVLSRDG